MRQILKIDTSSNFENSVTRKLTTALVDKIQSKNPNVEIKFLDLANNPVSHLTENQIKGFRTPENERNSEQMLAVEPSDNFIKDLFWADVIVIGVPMINFSIPSVLKSWIDQVCRAGVTFKYSENGPIGLVSGKKVYLLISSGGVYTEGFMKSMDFTESYLRAVFGFMGIQDVTAFRAEGIAITGNQESAIDKAISSMSI